jgi:L-asparaginase
MRKSDSVLIIYTGGTIGMYKTNEGSLRTFDLDTLSMQIPELNTFDIDINTITIAQPIDSSNMCKEVWIQLVEIIEKEYNNYNGFVILHGSDTMAYTASALSFMLENLNKPIILTGAQLPIGVLRTDARENIITSIEIASKGNIPEVCVYFEYQLMRGNRCTKANAEHFEAFKSPNFMYLAEAGLEIKYSPIKYDYKNKNLKVHTNLCEDVLILKVFPSMKKEFITKVLEMPYQGIILETFGAGNAPTAKWFLRAIQRALDNGKLILNVSQCLSGSVSQGMYETSSKLEELGVISGKDMTTEAALAKMMFLLGTNYSHEKIKQHLLISLRGELSN